MANAGNHGISGFGLSAVVGGSILLWAALKGRKWSDVVRELVSGEQPGTSPDYPIVVPERSGESGDTNGTGGTATDASGWDDAEASSYWGIQTASGKKMTATTIASPYLPLGTQVEINYKGKTVSGTVWDFGPADWVMATNPDRFLDLAEPMMQQLTGTKSNTVKVKYRITRYGTGRIYRPSHSMTKQLRDKWA